MTHPSRIGVDCGFARVRGVVVAHDDAVRPLGKQSNHTNHTDVPAGASHVASALTSTSAQETVSARKQLAVNPCLCDAQGGWCAPWASCEAVLDPAR